MFRILENFLLKFIGNNIFLQESKEKTNKATWMIPEILNMRLKRMLVGFLLFVFICNSLWYVMRHSQPFYALYWQNLLEDIKKGLRNRCFLLSNLYYRTSPMVASDYQTNKGSCRKRKKSGGRISDRKDFLNVKIFPYCSWQIISNTF